MQLLLGICLAVFLYSGYLSFGLVLILEELRSLPQSSTYSLSTTLLINFCPYQTCYFQYCYQLSLEACLRPSLQPSRSPLIFPFHFEVEELYGTWYQNDSFSLINVGSGLLCLRRFFFFLRAQGNKVAKHIVAFCYVVTPTLKWYRKYRSVMSHY